jgi:phosphinothricin acetyltransferase
VSLEVRSAIVDDLCALTDIYNHYVVTSPTTFDIRARSIEETREWFTHYAVTGRYRLLVTVEREGGAVLGYATSSRFRDRPAYATSVETSVYVHPRSRGHGVGSALYRALFDQLRGEDVHRAFAGIAVPNDPSVALHERFGFRVVGTYTEVGRKFGRYWDVLWMEKAL